MAARRIGSCLRPISGRHLLAPSILALAGLALIPFASTLFTTTHRVLQSLPLESVFSTAVQFASPAMIAVMFLIIWILDSPKRSLLTYFLVALLVAGNINSVIKQVAGRTRPNYSVAMSNKREARLEKSDPKYQSDEGHLRQDRWLWFSPNRAYFSDRYASFPSGHACSVFAAAAFLCAIYNRARYLWLAAAIMCALARVRFERHFPEDVMVGGAIGWTVALWVFSWCWPLRLGIWFDRKMEARVQSRS
jgi:membrane-associated phospholipid phosphatase